MENSRLSQLLLAITSSISLSLILWVFAGPWLFAETIVVSAIAVFGWLRFSHKRYPSLSSVAPGYIISIVLFLILSCIRYASGFSNFIAANYHPFFNGDFVPDHTNWFLLMVCLPASLMLLGGYSLTKRAHLGFFFAWWSFVFCMVESVLQLKIELSNLHSYSHQYYPGVFVAMAMFLLSTNGIMKLIKPATEEKIRQFRPLTTRQINLWSVLLIAFVVVYGTILYAQAGFLPVGVIVGAMMGGMIGWRKTTARFPADPYKLVPLYLLLQALFYIHVGEEAITHFNRSIAALSGHAWSDKEFDWLISFIGQIIWIFAAWSLWKGQAFGNFILWFMIVGMILGEPVHILVFPVAKMVKEGGGYEYFPGMFTALFPMIPAILALVVILKEKKQRAVAHA